MHGKQRRLGTRVSKRRVSPARWPRPPHLSRQFKYSTRPINPLVAANDAFDQTLGSESIGLYTPRFMRSFNPAPLTADF
jgi:hypothetical protein